MADRPIRSAATKTPTWTELNELTSSSLGGEVNVLESSLFFWRCSFVVYTMALVERKFHTLTFHSIFFIHGEVLD